MPVVVVSLRRRSHAQRAGLTPYSFLPLHPVRLRCLARGVSSVFVSGDAYANPAVVLFLSLKSVVLSVVDGRRPGRTKDRLMEIPSDACPKCVIHIERAVR